jgi:hypothetical protein
MTDTGGASKNLFSGGGSTTTSDDARTVQGASSSSFGPFTQRYSADTTWGRSAALSQYKALPFDFAAALQDAPVAYRASSNRVMRAEDAAARLSGILKHCGATGQVESVQLAFLKAILLSHAKNSGSVLQPSRAVFQVAGSTEFNFFTDVVQFLGDDTRRFFRAYAELSRTVVAERIKAYRDGDETASEDYRDIMMVARERDLVRYPELIADCADACVDLTQHMVDTLQASKKTIFATTPNMVDLVRSSRVATRPTAPTDSNSYLGPAGVPAPDY